MTMKKRIARFGAAMFLALMMIVAISAVVSDPAAAQRYIKATAYAVGSVLFAAPAQGLLLDDAANFSYDSTAHQLKLAADGLKEGGVVVPQYFYISYRQSAGETPTTATIWTAPAACQLVSVTENHKTAGTDAGAVTLSLSKDPSGTAPGGGTGLLTATISLKATANTNQSGALSGTTSDLQFAAGDGLSVVFSGTMTSVAGVSVTLKFKRI